MDRTNSTLLERVRVADDREAWQSFFKLYFPLLAKYARMHGLRAAEAEEVAQDCMATLARWLPRFRYSRLRGHFRNLLQTIVVRRIAAQYRRRAMKQAGSQVLANVPAPADADDRWEQLWLREHMLFCLHQVQPRCAPRTFEAFRLYALQEMPVQEVCRRLNLTPNQVYVAKARIIRRLRRAVSEMIGEVI